MNVKLLAISLTVLLLLGGCAQNRFSAPDGPPRPGDGPLSSNSSAAINPHQPLKVSQYGNPATYTVAGHRYHVLKTANGYQARGLASWYGRKFHGQLTSTREPYDMFAMTAASTTLPIPVYARVTNLENGRSIVVKVNDRGPFHSNRIIDLSYGAAKELGFLLKGTAPVEVKALSDGTRQFAHHVMQRYLQIATFSRADHALALKRQLANYVHQTILVKAVSFAQRTFYRVQIGPLVDENESARLHHLLHRLGLGIGRTVTIAS